MGSKTPTNTCNSLESAQMFDMSQRLLALPDLSYDASVWEEAGRSPEWS